MTTRRQLTPSGYARIEKEIRKLMNVDLPRLINHLRDVREDNVGNDEDPELHNAMVDKERLEDRINQLQAILNGAQIIDENNSSVINIGDRVVVYDRDYDEELTLDMVDGAEVIAGRRGISSESPLGQALLGAKVGDTVEIDSPDGTLQYKVCSFAPIPDDDADDDDYTM
jgi:transcription elongation factor GreA